MGALRAWFVLALATCGCRFDTTGAEGGLDPVQRADAGPADAGLADAPCLTSPAYVPRPGSIHRYRAVDTAMSYDEAIAACAADGAHLAAIDSSAENVYVAGLFPPLADGLWIGFDDLTTEDVFRWVTGAPVLFTQWNPFSGEPNDFDGEDCTQQIAGGAWNDFGCEAELPAVCECDPFFRPPPAPACMTNAAYGLELDGRRYRLRPDASFSAAVASCEGEGAHLVAIGDDDENDAVAAAIDNDTWIGYTDASSQGDFVWVNGAPPGFEAWGDDQPDNGGGGGSASEDCVAIRPGGGWDDEVCAGSNMHPHLCECDPSPP